MQHLNLLLALFVYLLAIGAFLFVWMRQDRPRTHAPTPEEQTLASVRSDLMAIRLFARALMEQEHGKLNYAQIEMIHRIFAQSDRVIRHINQFNNVQNRGDARPRSPARRPHLATAD